MKTRDMVAAFACLAVMLAMACAVPAVAGDGVWLGDDSDDHDEIFGMDHDEFVELVVIIVIIVLVLIAALFLLRGRGGRPEKREGLRRA